MSNAKNVAKLVEQAVRNELRNSPGFAGLSKGFEQSVLELVKRGVQEGFKKVLFLTWGVNALIRFGWLTSVFLS